MGRTCHLNTGFLFFETQNEKPWSGNALIHLECDFGLEYVLFIIFLLVALYFNFEQYISQILLFFNVFSLFGIDCSTLISILDFYTNTGPNRAIFLISWTRLWVFFPKTLKSLISHLISSNLIKFQEYLEKFSKSSWVRRLLIIILISLWLNFKMGNFGTNFFC